MGARYFKATETQQYHEARGFVPGSTDLIAREFRDQIRDVDGLSFMANATVKARLIGMAHKFQMGADWYDETSILNSRIVRSGVAPLSLSRPVYSVTARDVARAAVLPFAKTDTRTRRKGAYLQDQIGITDALLLVGGVRYEVDTIRRWTVATPDRFVLEKTFRNATWRAGLVYQPVATLSLYAQYATGVDPLGTLTTVSTGQVQFSNAKGHQVEAGAKWLFANGRGTATLAAYRIVKTGLLAQRTLASPVEQIGQRSSQGVEAAVTFDLPQGFGIDANGTLLDARFDDFRSSGVDYSGRTSPNVPETLANLWLRWDASAKVQLRAGLRYVGRRFSDNGEAFRIPGYATVDTTLSYALTPRLAVDVRVYNLFDKAYAVTAYGDQQWILGRPRALDVAFRAGFCIGGRRACGSPFSPIAGSASSPACCSPCGSRAGW